MGPGTRVRYTTEFLQSTGMYTGPEAPTSHGPFARGTIVDTRAVGPAMLLSTVDWDDGERTRINTLNVEEVRTWNR